VVGVCAIQDGVEERAVRPDDVSLKVRDRSGSDVELTGRPVKGDGQTSRLEVVEDVERIVDGEEGFHQKTSGSSSGGGVEVL